MILDKDYKNAFLDDIIYMQKVIKDKGFYLSLESCEEVWWGNARWFDELPDNDDAIWDKLFKNGVMKKINETRQNKIKNILKCKIKSTKLIKNLNKN
jgi:hypothetical protein